MTNQEYNKAYYSNHREALKSAQRDYTAANREAIAVRSKKAYQENRDSILAQKKEYGKRNREKLRAKNISYYSANRKRLVEYARRYRKEHPDQVRLRNRKYYAKHPEKARRWSRIYLSRNPHKVAEFEARRRGLEKSAFTNLAGLKAFYSLIRAKKKTACYYCGALISGKSAHFDHIIPLSRGGQHSAENLCVSCGSCNQSKHNKMLPEWTRHAQQFLPL